MGKLGFCKMEDKDAVPGKVANAQKAPEGEKSN